MLHCTLPTHVSYHVRTITGPVNIHAVSLHPFTFPIGLEQDLCIPSPLSVVLTGFTPCTLPI